MRARRVLGRLSAGGASAQVAIAGSYAWAVTVAPVAGYHGASTAAKVAAALALVALYAGVAAERWRPGLARLPALAGFAGASMLAWLCAPAALAPIGSDTIQGLAGMLGWALFALASAGPALGEPLERERVVDDGPLEARRTMGAADAATIVGGTASALALQAAGWGIADSERALLVRMVAVATGLAVIGASVEIALARHVPRQGLGARARFRRARVPFAILGALALSGLLLSSRG